MFRRFLSGILDLVYPHQCVLCRRPLILFEQEDRICVDCAERVALNIPPNCGKCSRPLDSPVKKICGTCLEHEPHFDRAWGACVYTDTLRKLLHLFKYSQRTGLRHFFVKRILQCAHVNEINFSRFNLLVPVPLHPVRLRERGFNQAEFISRRLSVHLGIPLSHGNLQRNRNTKSQARLSEKDRWTNIQGAFKIKNFKTFEGKNLLLVDDLLTTGGTASEAAKLLKSAGALEVSILTLAVAKERFPDRMKSLSSSRYRPKNSNYGS